SKILTDMMEQVVKPIVPAHLLDDETKYHINTTGRFVVGGPQEDVGLTGRKIIVDKYGGVARHGGGAFSVKDPTKVDRAAAYAARYVAKFSITYQTKADNYSDYFSKYDSKNIVADNIECKF